MPVKFRGNYTNIGAEIAEIHSPPQNSPACVSDLRVDLLGGERADAAGQGPRVRRRVLGLRRFGRL